MTEQKQIISLTPGLQDAVARAQRLSNDNGEPFGIWEHVGLYGQPSGDIAARHTFMVRPLSKPDPEPVYALVGCVDPHKEFKK